MKQRKDFDITDAFRSIDVNDKSAFNKRDLQTFLEKGHYYATAKELQYIIERFDIDQDGQVSFVEFVLELTPKLFEQV